MRLMHEKLEEMAPDVGRVTILWSELHFWVFCVFYRVLGAGIAKGDTAFFTLRSDRAQRELTETLVKQHMPEDDPLRGRILVILDEINKKLAGRRNAIIHAIWFYSQEDAPVKVWASSARKLSQKDVKAELTSLQSDIFNLTTRLMPVVADLEKRYPDDFKPLFELLPFRKSEDEPPDGA
jgi:hypothetical protein